MEICVLPNCSVQWLTQVMAGDPRSRTRPETVESRRAEAAERGEFWPPQEMQEEIDTDRELHLSADEVASFVDLRARAEIAQLDSKLNGILIRSLAAIERVALHDQFVDQGLRDQSVELKKLAGTVRRISEAQGQHETEDQKRHLVVQALDIKLDQILDRRGYWTLIFTAVGAGVLLLWFLLTEARRLGLLPPGW